MCRCEIIISEHKFLSAAAGFIVDPLISSSNGIEHQAKVRLGPQMCLEISLGLCLGTCNNASIVLRPNLLY